MWWTRRRSTVALSGVVLSVLFGLGVTQIRPVQAATQVSTADGTSTEQTLSDKEFKDQITAKVDDDQPIKDVFKDPRLAKAVATGLNASIDDNLKEVVASFPDGYSGDHPFTISPDDAVSVEKPIMNWTGLSALKPIFNSITVIGQPDFDQKAADLVRCLGLKDNLELNFERDDLTNKGFEQLMDMSSDYGYTSIDVNQNQITDFSAINKAATKWPLGAQIDGIQESGSVQESALKVNNGSITIKGGIPGAELLPQAVIRQENLSNRFGRFRLESPNETSSYLASATSTFPDGEEVKPVEPPVTFAKLDKLNQVSFDNHNWQYIYPWSKALGLVVDPSDFPEIDFTQSDVQPQLDRLKRLQIKDIPSNVHSVTIRSVWANTYAEGPHHIITTLVNYPLIRDNSQSATTMSNETATSQSTITNGRTKVAQKGQAVYALKKVGLYRRPTFTPQNRRHFYPQKPRTQRPQFVVTGYARSQEGRLRYRVRDVNHHSATFDQHGYLTAATSYVVPTYYQRAPKRIRVINPKGVNGYRQKNLTHQVKHYRRGQVLRVKKLVFYHLTSRLVLSNGDYLTANKTLVQAK